MQLNTNLEILKELNLDFDRYLLLFHLTTGKFEKVEGGSVFDDEKFGARFPGLMQKDPAVCLRALHYSGHITLRMGSIFTVTKPAWFSPEDLQIKGRGKRVGKVLGTRRPVLRK